MLHSRSIPVLKPFQSVFEILNWINPGAEDNTVTGTAPIGWTVTQGNTWVRVAEAIRPHPTLGESNIFDGGTSSSSRAYQRLSIETQSLVSLALVDAGRVAVRVNWLGGTFIQANNDKPELNIYFRNASLTQIGSASSGLVNPVTVYGQMRWDAYETEAAVPVGTRYIDVELHSDRNAGTNNDAAFDNVIPTLIVS